LRQKEFSIEIGPTLEHTFTKSGDP